MSVSHYFAHHFVHLKELTTKRSEDTLIAAPLAARLGLLRVFAIDDPTADSGADSEAEQKAFGEAMQRLWDNPATAQRKANEVILYAQLDTSEGLLAMYRAFNKPEQAQLVYESDFGAAMKDHSA